MSVVTLKRKTQTKYNAMSTGLSGFSLNGTHRNQGYVGQTSLSRSLPSTPFKGTVAKGHGGCCGEYRVAPVVQSAVTSTNNPDVVKSSVMSTRGMLATKYAWTKRGDPETSVKPDATLHINNASDYIEYIRKKSIRENCSVVNTEPQTMRVYNELPRQARPRVSRLNPTCPITIFKPATFSLGSVANSACAPSGVAEDQDMYILHKSIHCGDLDTLQQTHTGCKVPFGKRAK